jgi:hypothetical protein
MAVDAAEKQQVESVAARTRGAMVTVMIEGTMSSRSTSPLASSFVWRESSSSSPLCTRLARTREPTRAALGISDVHGDTTHAKAGDGSAKRAFVPQTRSGEYPEPDVAVLETSPTAILRPAEGAVREGAKRGARCPRVPVEARNRRRGCLVTVRSSPYRAGPLGVR